MARASARMTYTPNPRLAEQIDGERPARRVRESHAATAEARTRAIGWSIRYTGDYARSIRRSGDVVYSVDPAAMFIEFGSRNNPPFAPLRRGADATGAEVRW